MMVVADTHSWIWWASAPRKLSSRARRALEEADEIGVCSISCWELAMLVAKSRLELDRDVLVWIKQSLALPRMTLLPLTPECAVLAAELTEECHGDPADRIIVATTLKARARLVTRDRRIRSFRKVQSVW